MQQNLKGPMPERAASTRKQEEYERRPETGHICLEVVKLAAASSVRNKDIVEEPTTAQAKKRLPTAGELEM
jgi:hypothetical protein